MSSPRVKPTLHQFPTLLQASKTVSAPDPSDSTSDNKATEQELAQIKQQQSTVQPSNLLKILELEELDPNLYRGFSPSFPRWGRIYGGQTVAQSLVAAFRTVESHLFVHSLHAYFLRAGNDDLPILYHVERLRDGSSFSSRRVTALQKGHAIFTMSVSFQRMEQGLEHQDAMPKVPEPENVPCLLDTYKQIVDDTRFSPRIRKGLARSMALPFPMDLRRVEPKNINERLQKNPPRQLAWMCVQGRLPDSLMLHQCALAYLSDWSLLETALLPHGLHGWVQVEGQTLQMASIDHAMWFHHPFRADEYLLYEMDSDAASGGRGLAFGKIFTRDGKLVVTTAQEGLIRVVKTPTDKTLMPPKTSKSSNNSKVNSSTKSSQVAEVPPPRSKL